MTNSPYNRRSLRLPEFDYATPGAYFVTVCIQDKECLFGKVVNAKMELNEAGEMIREVWQGLPDYYSNVGIDTFIVMPNHLHGLINLKEETVGAAPCGRPEAVGQAQGPAPTLSLPDVMHRFKSITTRRYADFVKLSDWPPFSGRLWQRNYYEHVVRRTDKLARIREYVLNNPLRWELDRENPECSRGQ